MDGRTRQSVIKAKIRGIGPIYPKHDAPIRLVAIPSVMAFPATSYEIFGQVSGKTFQNLPKGTYPP